MLTTEFEDILRKYSAVNTHTGTDKMTSHSYNVIYSNLFSIYKNTKSVLEIGFDGGASLQAYSEYFQNATIYGIDIEDNCLDFVKQNPRIQTYIGDATKESTIHHFSGTHDLIIEDASHMLHHQVQHFHDFHTFVNPGGLYIIEDVAEANLEALKEHLEEFSNANGFTMYIFDLRAKKGRFDDILFVFQKKPTETVLLQRFLTQLSNTDASVMTSLQDAIDIIYPSVRFEDPVEKSLLVKYLTNAKSEEAIIFFTKLYASTEWKYFCELFLYPHLVHCPFFTPTSFPLEEYKKLSAPIIPEQFKRVSLDVGMAFNGPNTSEWVKNPEMFVLGFEPNPTNLKYLHMPFDQVQPPPNYPYDKPDYWLDSKYIGKQVQIYPFALSNETGLADFYCTTNDPGTSSLYKPIRFGLEGKISVPKHTLNSILVMFPWGRIPYIDHLKIDAQGHDFEILLGALSYLDRIAYINVEMTVLGQYEDVPNKFPLMNILLQSQGFRAYNMEGGNCSYVNTKLSEYSNSFKPQFIDL